MKEMAMYYYACKLSSMASCSGRRREGGCSGCGTSTAPSTSGVPSTSTAGCSCCSRSRHKSKHKVTPLPWKKVSRRLEDVRLLIIQTLRFTTHIIKFFEYYYRNCRPSVYYRLLNFPKFPYHSKC
ncbi:UNVERIFIED_CONTAM: hypothetical protein PYX00_002389 [Menopon gallinae]|uniref:Uncharacterized protein n=1 Tax=Menopon gallinae TaxID=328185 RepID=A0AAW2IGM1_9NEOP